MFTGIVTATGRVAALRPRAGGARLEVQPPAAFGRLTRGESVCVSGVCLTALEAGRTLVADLSSETLERSSLGTLVSGERVNLERALRYGDRLSGHFVMGHVDGRTTLLDLARAGNSWTYRLSVPRGLSRLIVEKGSVALDGVSLTVSGRSRGQFEVAVIPETRRKTTLGEIAAGRILNLEADVFARYGAAGWRRAVDSDGSRRPSSSRRAR